MVEIQGKTYHILENKKNAFQQERFEERYSDILSKYDYIVGDWGYEQLRLKGFYNDHHAKATFDNKISTFEDYLYEHCNFGCAYFIIQKVD
ncbi:MAG TPA: YutD family protein [Virgibacillus sp.]|nr:YutD family protein [Virgibacillus sp.]